MSELRLHNFIPYRLSVAANAVSRRISDSYRRRFGLKIAEWRVIAILAEHDRMTPQDIGNKGELDKITVSRSATALIDRGLLLQKRNPEDGRSHFLQLTPDGRSLYEEIAPAALRLEQDLLSRFSKEDRAQLQSLLRRIEDAANSP